MPTCKTGKDCHASKAAALKSLGRRMKLAKPDERDKIRPYRCEISKTWHIGH